MPIGWTNIRDRKAIREKGAKDMKGEKKRRKKLFCPSTWTGHTLVVRQKEIVSTVMTIFCTMVSCCPEFVQAGQMDM
jgi:hypothetical protein